MVLAMEPNVAGHGPGALDEPVGGGSRKSYWQMRKIPAKLLKRKNRRPHT